MTLQIRDFEPALREPAVAVFERSFTEAEGAEEGQIIASLVRELIDSTRSGDLQGQVMCSDEEAVAAVFFSRLKVSTEIDGFLLSPMAVLPSHQRQGHGQRLVREGLERLAKQGVALVMTYGDPAFYGKIGFERISEQQIPAPYALSQPQGWLALSLIDAPIPHVQEAVQCVPAFRNPALW